MDSIESAARKYKLARTPVKRRELVEQLQDAAREQALFAAQPAIVALLGAPTFGDGRSAIESPVQLIAPFMPDSRELSTWLMQRYLQAFEFLALLKSPHFSAQFFPDALNNLWSRTSDRPRIPFSRWLGPAIPDWSELSPVLSEAQFGHQRHGPEVPNEPQFEPFWLSVLEHCAVRLQSPDLPRWLVRAHGICGQHAVNFAARRAIVIDRTAFVEEVEALEKHLGPDGLTSLAFS